jgi:hypothetical protein
VLGQYGTLTIHVTTGASRVSLLSGQRPIVGALVRRLVARRWTTATGGST